MAKPLAKTVTHHQPIISFSNYINCRYSLSPSSLLETAPLQTESLRHIRNLQSIINHLTGNEMITIKLVELI